MPSTPIKVILRSGKDDALRRYHPWLFSGAIKKIIGPAYDGAHAEVFSNKEEYLGSGIYQDATIAVKLLSFAPDRPAKFDNRFWEDRLRKAFELRKHAHLTNNAATNVYRLVHGEGDHLPGLIIDHYNGYLVIQIHSTGLYPYLVPITNALKNIYGESLKGVVDKSRATLPEAFWQQLPNKATDTMEGKLVEVLENNHRFIVDIEKGQKTGFFIDQRENRWLLAQYSNHKRILNTFCYSGGFSVYALGAGATEVHSLDSSASAMELTHQNVLLNHSDNPPHLSITGDALSYLQQSGETYDVIILDPPAFAKHVHVKHNAVQGYKRLNQAAMAMVRPGGTLFTFSCSQVVDMQLFRNTVMAAAIQSGRQARLLHQLSQPADHPVNVFHPEGQYLKGLVLYID